MSSARLAGRVSFLRTKKELYKENKSGIIAATFAAQRTSVEAYFHVTIPAPSR